MRESNVNSEVCTACFFQHDIIAPINIKCNQHFLLSIKTKTKKTLERKSNLLKKPPKRKPNFLEGEYGKKIKWKVARI